MAKTNYLSESVYVVAGTVLNQVGLAINSLSATGPETDERGFFHHDKVKPTTILGVVEITDDAETCDVDETIGTHTSYSAPCRTRNLYKVRFVYWDAKTLDWIVLDDPEFDLDADSFYTYDQRLFKGERLNVYFDPLRGRLVPIFPSPATYLVELLEDLDGSDGTTATHARAKVLQRDPTFAGGGDAIIDHQSSAEEDVEVVIYSWYTAGQSTGDKILANRDAFGDLWMSSVDCPAE